MQIEQVSLMSVMIKMYFNEIPISTGTAFLTPGSNCLLLITNRHNFTGRNNDSNELLDVKNGAIPNRIEVYHNKRDVLGDNIIKSEFLYENGDLEEGLPLWFEHPTLKEKADFVALKMTDLEGVAVFSYSLRGANISVGVTDAISVIGFPFGIQVGKNVAVWATGTIASEPAINYKNLPIFLIDCRSRQGQSGSPVIAYRPGGVPVNLDNRETAFFDRSVFRFLGIYSGRINKESDLGIVWKVEAIQELIRSIR